MSCSFYMPQPSKYNGIALVGEFPDEQEALTGMPFIGSKGSLLTSLCKEAGIDKNACFATNVFQEPPPSGEIKNILVSKKLGAPNLPPVVSGKYLPPEYLPILERLRSELTEAAPKYIIALGNVAAWALLQASGIGKLRGTWQQSILLPDLWVLPTLSPAALFKQWDQRCIVTADLQKAMAGPPIPGHGWPERVVMVADTVGDIRAFHGAEIKSDIQLGCDIETAAGQITCIGFAVSPHLALVVPFVDMSKPGGHYWETPELEAAAMRAVRDILLDPVPKVFHNGYYDIFWIAAEWHMAVANCAEDTMLLHHAMQPEMKKSLGFLGSLYVNAGAWKTLRAVKPEKQEDDE